LDYSNIYLTLQSLNASVCVEESYNNNLNSNLMQIKYWGNLQ
jgi:hypothetical protein